MGLGLVHTHNQAVGLGQDSAEANWLVADFEGVDSRLGSTPVGSIPVVKSAEVNSGVDSKAVSKPDRFGRTPGTPVGFGLALGFVGLRPKRRLLEDWSSTGSPAC